jgi:ketosteroid isomerase-like protein
MKANITLALIILSGLLIAGCNQNQQNQKNTDKGIDIINDEFPEAQVEIKAVLDSLFRSLQNKDAESLKSFHLYGPKFTAFAPGMLRQGSKENQEKERETINSISSFEYNLNDLKINVFGEVAIVTYHGDFEITIETGSKQMYTQTSLIFVKTDTGWKLTHEHSSPRIID